MKKILGIVPTEFNGKAAEALKDIESPGFKAEIKKLTKNRKLNAVEAGKRLRAKTWGAKSAVEILEELEQG